MRVVENPAVLAAAARNGCATPLVCTAGLPATPWDPPVAAALADRGRAVFEEQVIATLLG